MLLLKRFGSPTGRAIAMERIGHKVNLGGVNTVLGYGVRWIEMSSIHLFKPDPMRR